MSTLTTLVLSILARPRAVTAAVTALALLASALLGAEPASAGIGVIGGNR